MYRIYLLLCAVNTMAFDSNEEKYIDLLPEAEKQEFLNRIARRILEEIQSKESPEQAQADVTDDQLAAHDAYVQDLLKEESENHRHERRDISHKETENNYDDERKNNLTVNLNNTRNNVRTVNDNRYHHIDLTLRTETKDLKDQKLLGNNARKEAIKEDTNSFSVIPVKVIHDQQSVKPNNPTRYDNVFNNKESLPEKISENLPTSDETINNNSEIGENLTKIAVTEITSSRNIGPQGTTVKQIQKENDKNFKYSEADEHIKSITSNEKKSNVDIKKSKYEDASKPVTTITDESNKNIDKIKNNDELKSSQIEMSNSNQVTENPTQGYETYDKTTSVPLTEATTFQTSDKKRDLSNEDDNDEDDLLITHKTKAKGKPHHETGGIKFKNIDKNTILNNRNEESVNYKKHLRKRLEILSEEYFSVEKMEPNKNIVQKKKPQNKEHKQHLVYEVSPKNPLFAQKEDSKENEQPYYIPIYNFAPNHAYYNAENLYGPGTDEDVKRPGRNSAYDNEEELDRDLYKHGGYELLIDPVRKHRDNVKDKLEHLTRNHFKPPRFSEIIYKIQPKTPKPYYNSDFDMNYYYDDTNTLRQHPQDVYVDESISKWVDDTKTISRVQNDPDFGMDYYMDTGSDGLRRRNKNNSVKKKNADQNKNYQYHGGHFPDSDEEDHPYNSIYKDNIKNHVQAVKNLLYRKKKFGFMSPTPYLVNTEPVRKRVFDERVDLTINDNTARRNQKKTVNNNINTNSISMDYYWGRYGNINMSDFVDYFLDSTPDKTKLTKIKNVNNQKFKSKNVLKTSTLDNDAMVLDKLEAMDVSIEAITNVLRDMIKRDSRDLVSYDWLTSTVDIMGALNKLLELVTHAEKGNYIDRLDLKLLNDILYLYDTSNKILNKQALKESNQVLLRRYDFDIVKIIDDSAYYLRKIRKLPRGKYRKPGDKIRDPLNLWKNWYRYYIRILDKEDAKNAEIIKNFKQFLIDVQDNLYDFHNAINHIAMITSYTDQNWYQDLKNISLKSASQKKILQVVLHLSAAKLFDNIEKNTKNENVDQGEATKELLEDFVLVLRILERLKRFSY